MKFKDREGREYESRITVSVAAKLKNELGIDISRLAPEMLQRLSDDHGELFVSALWLSVEKSATPHGITPEEFGESQNGQSLADGYTALWEAIADFSHPSLQPALRRVIEVGNQAKELQATRATKSAADLTPESLLTSSKLAGKSPESSESTLAISP